MKFPALVGASVAALGAMVFGLCISIPCVVVTWESDSGPSSLLLPFSALLPPGTETVSLSSAGILVVVAVLAIFIPNGRRGCAFVAAIMWGLAGVLLLTVVATFIMRSGIAGGIVATATQDETDVSYSVRAEAIHPSWPAWAILFGVLTQLAASGVARHSIRDSARR